MLDPTKFRYRLILLTEKLKPYNISDAVEDLGWEELEKELAARITFTAKNDRIGKKKFSTVAKLGCYVALMCSYNGKKAKEVVRGRIVEWKPVVNGRQDKISIKCYDDLYNLQQSQDFVYYSDGIGTKSAVTQIFDKWKVPVGSYKGPDVTHGKLVYKTEKLSEVILKILKEAKKKGGEECVVRSVKGKVYILPLGSNNTVYHFGSNNSISVSHSMSTSGMVTRVKVLGEEDDNEHRPVEATVDGKTEYGIRQKVYTRGNDESIEEARNAAQEILKEDGKVDKDISVKFPDVPYIRKGNLVHIKAGTLNGYFYVKGVRHDCEKMQMDMDLKRAVAKQSSTSKGKKNYQVGDVVQYKGGTHYVSSYPGSMGYPASAGPARITIANGSGNAHPWHLIHTDSTSNVYGWVDEGSFD